MNVSVDWPTVEMLGLVRVELNRADLERLTYMLDVRSFGTPGLVGMHGDGECEVLAVVTVKEDAWGSVADAIERGDHL